MEGKKNHLKKQLNPYRNIPSKDSDMVKEVIYVISTVIKLYNVKEEGRTRGVQKRGLGKFPFTDTKTFFC